MVHERVADGATAAGHYMQVVGWEPALFNQQSDEHHRRQRRLAGRLEHHRASCGNRWSDLVGHEVEWEVERRDGRHDPDRHPHGEPDLALAHRCSIERDHLA